MTERIVCNPLDVAYRIQDTSFLGRRSVYREAADPSAVLFRDRYYLFASMSGGFWHSADLVDWEFAATPGIPFADYAPDVREIDGALVVCASKAVGRCDFFRSADPLSGRWERIRGTQTFWDPNLFQDDDGRVYLYEGCSNRRPIRGVELDRVTLRPIGRPVDLVGADAAARGWERVGEDWRTEGRPRAPYIEGAWMTKHAGRYHLQYSAPGAEYNTYADGVVVGDAPLGPFDYSPTSPVSSTPGGFIAAAGHGSTLQDRHGNWWHFATMRISVQHRFERRIGMFPAGFDADGNLVVHQELADHPFRVPDEAADPGSLGTGWMLQSYRVPAIASSWAEGHPPELAVDEDVRTWWRAAAADPAPNLTIELSEAVTVHAVQLNLADEAADPPRARRGERQGMPPFRRVLRDGSLPVLLEASTDGERWVTLADTRAESAGRPHLLVTLDEPAAYRLVRVVGGSQPYGTALAVSGLRVFGHRAGAAPVRVDGVRARRSTGLDAVIEWAAADGAEGYDVRYGLAPERLTHSWFVRGTRLELGALNAGHDYWVAVDAVGPTGSTPGEPVPIGR